MIYLDSLPEFNSPNACCDCRGEFGLEEGVYDTPVGPMCLTCYENFVYGPEQEREREALAEFRFYDDVEGY